MARVIPFKGILYNPHMVSGEEVVAPPYDIISPEFKEVLYQRSPHNVVRIDFGKDLEGDNHRSNRYVRARGFLDQWLQEGILVRDENSCFYTYVVEYAHRGVHRVLHGLLGLVQIEELGHGVYPHEATHSKPKTDRLNLMRACMGNMSPIYSLYHGPERITSSILAKIPSSPLLQARDGDGALHSIYRISDPAAVASIVRELSDRAIFIADGHHRYEVALEFKKEMDRSRSGTGDRPWDYALMFLANIADEGITILPTHRMVKGLPRADEIMARLGSHFTSEEAPIEQSITDTLRARGKNTFGLYFRDSRQWRILSYRGDTLDHVPLPLRRLDVVILHDLILERDLGIREIAYEMVVREALRRVDNDEFDAAFFLNPTGVDDVERVALAHLRMPPKSTYFYPKLLTGMVINGFETT